MISLERMACRSLNRYIAGGLTSLRSSLAVDVLLVSRAWRMMHSATTDEEREKWAFEVILRTLSLLRKSGCRDIERRILEASRGK